MRKEYSAERKLVAYSVIVITFVLISTFSSSFLLSTSGSALNHAPSSVSLNPNDKTVSTTSPTMVHQFTVKFSVSISPGTATIDVGQSVTLSATENQSLTYTYNWFLNGKAVGSGLSSYSFTPSSSGSYSIYVNATNGTETVKSNTATVTVDSAPSVTISPSSEKVNVGQTVAFQSTVSGGTGSFVYLWYLNGSKTTVTTSSYSFTPTGNATYYVYVRVNDTGTYSGASPLITAQSSTSQITAVQVKYQITFQETGLQAGVKWFVNLTNGQTFSTVGSLNLFYEPNGTYHFSIASGNKNYYPNPYSGLFVISGSSYSVSINFYPVLYQVSFAQLTNRTLPPGTYWYVNISGEQPLSSNTSVVNAQLTNGSYTFTISSGNKDYYPTPYSGSLLVNGKAVSVPISFSPYTYTIEFTETGLPAGSSWSITIQESNGSRTISSTTQVASTILINDSYSYSVQSGVSNFGPYPSRGNFNISGASDSIAIRFLRLYVVSFLEAGLPLGQPRNLTWYVNVTDPQEFRSNSNSISFQEPNGTYSYNVSVNTRWYVLISSESSGNFTINGNNISPYPSTSPVTFHELFNVTFTVSHLANGSAWYVNVTNGTSLSTVTGSLSFTEINGTYVYSVATGNKLYRPVSYTSSYVVNGSSINLREVFVLVTYSVTFSETGLTSGTFWSITINNNTRISTNGSISFKLNNGSFEYSLQPISGFSTTDYSGNVSISGAPLVEPINWTMVTYAISISQSGIPTGKHWSVTLQGKTFNGISVTSTLNTTKSSVTFLEPNGTYNYTINAPFGYTGTHVTGKITINGKAGSAVASLVPPNYKLIGAVGAILVGILAVALFLLIRHDNRSFFQREGRYVRKGKLLKTKK